MKIYHQLDPNNYVLDSNDPNHKEFYAHQNHCCICGHELEIKTAQETPEELIEETFCPSCDTKTRKKAHQVQ